MDKVENIGLIGYGVMGKAIAKKLMKSYYHVFVYDNSESEMILAKKQGCFTCVSPQDLSLKTKQIFKTQLCKRIYGYQTNMDCLDVLLTKNIQPISNVTAVFYEQKLYRRVF